MPIHDWARQWLAEQWQEWQPCTRASAVEALAKLVMLATQSNAVSPATLRRYLHVALVPGSDRDSRLEEWLATNCLSVSEIDRSRVSEIDRQLGLKLDGSPLAASTANRIRIVARACINAAVSAGAIEGDPWPPRSRNRAHRKAVRVNRSVNIRSLPGPETMARATRRSQRSIPLAGPIAR